MIRLRIVMLLISGTFLWPAASSEDTFKHHPTTLRIGANVTSIAAADLNGDGLPEIVTTNRGPLADPEEERPAHDQLSYLVAHGNLSYVAEPQLRSGFAPYCVTIANVDGFKALDLVVGNFMATRNRDLTLLRNLGSDLFEPIHFSVPDEELRYTKIRDGADRPVFTTPGVTSVAVHDMDGDGYRDAIATGWSSDVLIYFPGQIEGYFGKPVLTRAHGGPRDIAVADLDRDGVPDLVTVMYTTNEVVLWKGDGTGKFVEVNRFPSRGLLPHNVSVVDINNDKRLDIVVAHCHQDDSIVLFYGEGDFNFSVSQEILLGPNRGKLEYEIRDLVVGDFNGDGRADLAVACYKAGQVVVLRNRSSGPEIPQRYQREEYAFSRGKPRALCISDFNQDGKPDLGVGLWETNSVSLLLGK